MSETVVKVTKTNNGKFSAEIVKNNAVPVAAVPAVEKAVEGAVEGAVKGANEAAAAAVQGAEQAANPEQVGGSYRKKRGVVSLRKRRNGRSRRNGRKRRDTCKRRRSQRNRRR